MMENGTKIKLKALVHIAGSMDVNTKVNGLIIIWMAWVSTPGLMEDAIWENIKMIKNTVTVSTNGLTVDYISDNGCVENNTVSEPIKLLKQPLNMVFGKRANV